MRLTIPYMDHSLEVDVPSARLLFDVAPRDVPAATDFAGTLRRALANPIGTRPLREVARAGQKVVVIADDNTRLTPTKQIVPVVLDELNAAGVPDGDIRVVVASGTHRPMTGAEMDAKYGPPVLSRVQVIPHRYKDPASLVEYGTTRRGTRIWVNRHVVEADLRVAIGNIIPHHPTGWSAGAKIVLPGVAGEETVAQMHLLGSRDPALGRIDTEMRREMEDFAEQIGLDFILNVVLNRSGELVDAVAGHFVEAHRAGVKISQQVYGVPIPGLADLVISSASPVDFDFFQADKGLFAAEPSVRIGGEIVLLSGCVEGVSPTHPELAQYVGRMNNEQIWTLLYAKQVPDPLTAAEALVINDLKDKVRITLVTEGLSPELCAALGFGYVSPADLAGYIRRRLAENPRMTVGVLRQSAEVLPVVTTRAPSNSGDI